MGMGMRGEAQIDPEDAYARGEMPGRLRNLICCAMLVCVLGGEAQIDPEDAYARSEVPDRCVMRFVAQCWNGYGRGLK